MKSVIAKLGQKTLRFDVTYFKDDEGIIYYLNLHGRPKVKSFCVNDSSLPFGKSFITAFNEFQGFKGRLDLIHIEGESS